MMAAPARFGDQIRGRNLKLLSGCTERRLLNVELSGQLKAELLRVTEATAAVVS
jgi:hypothetical protein